MVREGKNGGEDRLIFLVEMATETLRRPKAKVEDIVAVCAGLNVFDKPPTPAAISEIRDVAVRSTQTLTRDGPIPFEVKGRAGIYLDLSQTRVRIKLEIVKDDGTTLAAAGDNVGFVNNPLDSLFKQIDVSVGRELVTPADLHHPYKQYLHYLLSESPDTQDSLLQPRLWARDTPGHMENGDANTGFAARKTAGNQFELFGGLDFSVFEQDRMLVDNVDLRLSFSPTSDAFVLLKKTATTEANVRIVDMELVVREVVLEPTATEAMSDVLDYGLPALYPYMETRMLHFPQSARQTEIKENLGSFQPLPQRLIIAFVDTAAHTGDATKNPFNFKHFNITALRLKVNGRVLPETGGVKVDFAKEKVVEGYSTLLQTTGKYEQRAPLAVKMSDYSKGYAMFAYDLTESGLGPFTFHKKSGTIEMEADLSAALTGEVTMLVYTETQKTLSVDGFRTIHIR